MHRSGSWVGRQARRCVGRSVVAIALATVAVLVGFLGPGLPRAAAHAVVLSSTPAADQLVAVGPSEVRVTFTERVEVSDDSLDVIAPSGAHVATATRLAGASGDQVVAPVEATAEGTYTVVYRVVSADGHPVAGSFVFHVGTRSGVGVGEAELARLDGSGGVFSVVGWLGRWLAYSGLLVLLGVIVGRERLGVGLQTELDHGLVGRRGLAFIAGVAATVGAALIVVARASSVSGQPIVRALGSIFDLLGSSRAVRLDAARLGLALAATLCCRALPRHDNKLVPAAGTAAFAALGTFAVGGHAGTASPAALSVGLDLVHLLGAAVWLGGLSVVLITVRAARESGEVERAHGDVVRFSKLAILVFPLIAATGVGSSLFHVGSVQLLFSTTYGRLLLAKLLGVALIAVLAWINRGLVAKLATRGEQLLATMTMERDVALAVVGITAVLVFSVPAVTYDVGQSTDRYESTQTVNDTSSVRLVVTPTRVGDNDLEIAFLDGAGRPRRVDVAVVDISTESIPARKVEVDLGDGSVARASRVSFGAAGRWTVQVRSVTDGVSETLSFQVEVR